MGTSSPVAPGGFRERTSEAGIRSVLGIRYARLSGGERFAAPVAAAGQLDVDRLAGVPVFPQLRSRLAAAMGTGEPNPQAEDAFFLNVWAPANAIGAPVVVFVHGGAWMGGGGSNEWYDGSLLAAEGMVVVTVNYRLGPVAHLAPPDTPDLPLQDLALALAWVRENIGAFGGNPDEVTVAGQSAGAWYVHLLSLDPAARGLMRRVALLSMATRQPWTRERLGAVRDAAARLLHPQTMENAGIPDLLRAGAGALQETALPRPVGHAASGYLPSEAENIPGRFLDPAWCAQHRHVEEVLLSFTADETATFFFASDPERAVTHEMVEDWIAALDPGAVPPAAETRSRGPYERLVAISSWIQFQRFPTELHAAYRQRGLASELMELSMRSPLPGLMGGHCLDLPFWFGTRRAWADAPMLEGTDPEQFARQSLVLRRRLAGFVLGRPEPPPNG
ncbi:carboxylesterase family protein [Paeniglutamicibacter sp. ABSL32-1]|uniref:carboxylesterase family protein n=1 Tax=Paeniglutamicibacter quisquiliarum TaxID=2849498 RepID=UPI001C2D7AC7|nr:carboxylesterase family protein [Paeniglutamicibacter quisquiliarum]MBV1781287.1 carboxylesterase family protein [Paeniglutamicibacter quisquiliarum]